MLKHLSLVLISLFSTSIFACSNNESPNLVEQNNVSDISSIRNSDALDKTYNSYSRYVLKVGDKNHDNKLSFEEILESNYLSSLPSGDALKNLIKTFDENKDNLLSKDELSKAARKSNSIYFNEKGFDGQVIITLRRFDKNNDDNLTYEELFADLKDNPEVNPMFDIKNHYIIVNADTNRDEKIDRTEIRDYMALKVEAYYEFAYQSSSINTQKNSQTLNSIDQGFASLFKSSKNK